VHVAVTSHPTAAWTAQQFREAFPRDTAPLFLVHDRDSAFAAVHSTIDGMGIREVWTAVRATLFARLGDANRFERAAHWGRR
jgi:hypothetical protein